MELSYWESRWNKDNTGFHMPDGYSGLRKFWAELGLPAKANVLVPLCGKTVDMLFLSEHSEHVIGVEISEKAVKSFFDENNLNYETGSFAEFKIYKSGNIQIWQGDFLKFPESKYNFDLIYDKAALVALPTSKRQSYIEKLLNIASSDTRILLHHFIYPQIEMNGPPFSVNSQEIEKYFAVRYSIDLLDKSEIPSEHFMPFRRRGLRSPIVERLLLLKPR